MDYSVFLAAVSLYIIRLIFFMTGLYRELYRKKHCRRDYQPMVSVIVPARNEENNIAHCIRSLDSCDYPKEKYEIIVVNDRSEDNTGVVLDNMKGEISNLKVIHVTEGSKKNNLRGKPGALQAGIDHAKGEIIMMTDADCIISEGWIRRITMSFGDLKVGIVSSITSIIGNRFFDHLQAVEWILNQTMGSGGIGNGVPFGCFGNNLSVRADTYNKLGGYGKIKFSVTEDLALLQAVVHSGERARYYPDKDSLVFTKPCETFAEFKKQNHRWAVGGLDLGLKGWIFVAANFLIWLGIAYSLFIGDYTLLISLIATRVLGDLILITPTIIILREFRLFIAAIPSLFILMIWELFIPIMVIMSSEVKWKGQVFKPEK